MSLKKKCPNCGYFFSYDEHKCPSCDQTPEIYKLYSRFNIERIIFIIIIGSITGAIICFLLKIMNYRYTVNPPLIILACTFFIFGCYIFAQAFLGMRFLWEDYKNGLPDFALKSFSLKRFGMEFLIFFKIFIYVLIVALMMSAIGKLFSWFKGR